METGTQVNVVLLNTNLPYYNTVDKATSIMSKNIELGIINYVPLYQIQAKFTKLSQSNRKKFRQVIKLKIVQSLHHGRHCDHKTLKRAMCKFSFKSYEMLIEFWNQLAQIRSNFAKKALSLMSDRIQNTFVDICKHRFR